MAKIKGFSYLLNEEGQPISGADISIYLANSSTPAKIYTSETGTTATSAVPQLSTNADGYFEFGLGYDDDPLAYTVDQKFKISGDKTGITNGYNDYISIIPATASETGEPVNEEGFDTTRNKTVSDNLARGGEDHKDDMSYFVHGISAVDETDTDTTYNKLVNNNLAKGGEDHRVDTSYYVHGLEQVDETSTDATLNKLVSDDLAKGGEDHKDDMSYYVHGITAIDPNDPIDTTRNKLISNADYNSILTQLSTWSATLSSGSLTASGDQYGLEVTHGLSEDFPTVTVWDADVYEMIIPAKVETVDVNEIRIGLSEIITPHITVRAS